MTARRTAACGKFARKSDGICCWAQISLVRLGLFEGNCELLTVWGEKIITAVCNFPFDAYIKQVFVDLLKISNRQLGELLTRIAFSSF